MVHAYNALASILKASFIFGQYMRHHKMKKNASLHDDVESFLTCSSWWLGTCTRWHNSWALVNFCSSPPFFFFILLGFCIGTPKYKGVLSLVFYIQFGFYSYNYYLFFCFFIDIFIICAFNFLVHHLVLFNFYIKFRTHSFSFCFFLSSFS